MTNNKKDRLLLGLIEAAKAMDAWYYSTRMQTENQLEKTTISVQCLECACFVFGMRVFRI